MLGILLILQPLDVRAQSPEGQGEVNPQPEEEPLPTLEFPPKLKKLVPADIPEGTQFPSPLVRILLEIEVGDDGVVSSVKVLEGLGTESPFDAAALAAAKQFEFEPGRLSNGENVPVTVTFQMQITEPPPPPVEYSGTLLQRGTRRPLADAPVFALSGSEKLAQDITDEKGGFALTVPLAEFTLIAKPAGHDSLEVEIKAKPGEKREELFYLESLGDAFTTVIKAKKARREITQQIIPKDIAITAAGTQGDTIRVVENLPGVARKAFAGGGNLILRGSNPEDSAVYVEGLQIPQLYHFGGIRCTFNSAFLETIDFVPGNFSAEFGRVTGGIVNVSVRDPADDMFRGEVDLNLYDAGFVLEGPLGEGWSGGAAFHRSYMDTILPYVIPEDAPISFNTAPRYYDYQFLATWKGRKGHRFRTIYYGSLDKLIVLLDDPSEGATEIRGSIDTNVMFHNILMEYNWQIARGIRQDVKVQPQYQVVRAQIGPELFFDIDVRTIAYRATWTVETLPNIALRTGIDGASSDIALSLNLPQRPTESENPPPIGTLDSSAFQQDITLHSPGAFAEMIWSPVNGLEIIPGTRVDYYSEIKKYTVDPRLRLRYDFGGGSVIKGGVGYYKQRPSFDQTADDDQRGNPNLTPFRSLHVSIGAEKKLGELMELDTTAFYKVLDDIVVRNTSSYTDEEAPPYINQGTGRIYGLEVLLKLRPAADYFGWIAYTYQRSLRTDEPNGDERPFRFDQPHILTMLGTYRFGQGYSIGFRFRLISGNPDTPITGSFYDTVANVYVPTYGETNSSRLPLFHQLDVRFDKMWTWDTWRLTAYLDVQNVYLSANQEGWQYNYDFSDKQALTGLPIFPVIGAKGEW